MNTQKRWRKLGMPGENIRPVPCRHEQLSLHLHLVGFISRSTFQQVAHMNVFTWTFDFEQTVFTNEAIRGRTDLSVIGGDETHGSTVEIPLELVEPHGPRFHFRSAVHPERNVLGDR